MATTTMAAGTVERMLKTKYENLLQFSPVSNIQLLYKKWMMETPLSPSYLFKFFFLKYIGFQKVGRLGTFKKGSTSKKISMIDYKIFISATLAFVQIFADDKECIYKFVKMIQNSAENVLPKTKKDEKKEEQKTSEGNGKELIWKFIEMSQVFPKHFIKYSPEKFLKIFKLYFGEQFTKFGQESPGIVDILDQLFAESEEMKNEKEFLPFFLEVLASIFKTHILFFNMWIDEKKIEMKTFDWKARLKKSGPTVDMNPFSLEKEKHISLLRIYRGKGKSGKEVKSRIFLLIDLNLAKEKYPFLTECTYPEHPPNVSWISLAKRGQILIPEGILKVLTFPSKTFLTVRGLAEKKLEKEYYQK